MPEPVADSFDIEALWRLRRICFTIIKGTNTGCWCLNARDDGGHIPCQEASAPTAIDMLGRHKPAA